MTWQPPGPAPSVAIVGASGGTPEELVTAEALGERIAAEGWILICGGLGGVMDAAARGAARAGGTVVGILPGDSRRGASPHLTASVVTGMGEARNALVVRSADVVVAVGGEFGTLSEIALALKMGRPVIGIGTWSLAREGLERDPIARAATPDEAIAFVRDTLGAGSTP